MDQKIMEFARKYYAGGYATMIPFAKPVSASKEEIEMAKIVLPISKEEVKEIEDKPIDPPKMISIVMDKPVKPENIKLDIELSKNDIKPVKKEEKIIPISSKKIEKKVVEKKIMKAEDRPLPSITHIDEYVSKCSNAIRSYLVEHEIYPKISKFVTPKKVQVDYFYKRIQNCIYHTLRSFCGVIVSPGKDPVYTVPDYDTPFNETVRFLNNIMDPELKLIKNGDKFLYKLIENYREKTHALDGIQEEWFDNLKTALTNKFSNHKTDGLALAPQAIDMICDCIKEGWMDKAPLMSPVEDKEEEESEETVAVDGMIAELDKALKEPDEPKIELIESEDQETRDPDSEEDSDDESNEEEEDEESEEEDYGVAPLTIMVDESNIEGYDIISIINEGSDEYSSHIPFIVNLAELEKEAANFPLESVNGLWGWIKYVAKPILLFKTNNVEKFIEINSNPKLSGFKALDISCKSESGDRLMGLYYIDDEIGNIEECGDTLVRQVNYLVNQHITGTPMSVYYPLTVKEAENPNNIYEEKDVIELFDRCSSDIEEAEECECEECEDHDDSEETPDGLSEDVFEKILAQSEMESEEDSDNFDEENSDEDPEESDEESEQMVVLNENREVVSDMLSDIQSDTNEELEALDEAQYMKEAEQDEFTFKVRHKKRIEDF